MCSHLCHRYRTTLAAALISELFTNMSIFSRRRRARASTAPAIVCPTDVRAVISNLAVSRIMRELMSGCGSERPGSRPTRYLQRDTDSRHAGELDEAGAGAGCPISDSH